ncbi:MAG: ABC transporter ATP-binding protein [Pelotomaculum sp.]|uniref:ABC-type branched-chain amino acid transport systems, ATPase component n=1 Tax=Pelotomaculum thermopropionicum (strain DSM 13744 / JCM 10971 / SI) TaxID=370438 RepID=A5D539_PELTS|nr:ABC transporter ATP-binding protein [Pelotomaculum sp.]BAF58642.1 ABC-type branched-chain amino acid transport systems, ATPase component [Pelotomaculum thermopropionicum SI]
MSYFEVKDITKKFGGLTAVSSLSFTVEKGEIFGIIGPNGSGKTTVFNLISRFFPLTAGEIYFKGKRIDQLPAHKICEIGIGRTFQVVKPLRRMTVLENVMAGAFLRTNSMGRARHRAEEIIDFCGLTRYKEREAKSLPIPLRKRLEIARALATGPELLLLDETCAGLNPKESEEAIELIRKIRDTGITIIIIEHIMKVMMGISDRILAINFGRQIALGKPQEVANHPEVIKAYLGDAYA